MPTLHNILKANKEKGAVHIFLFVCGVILVAAILAVIVAAIFIFKKIPFESLLKPKDEVGKKGLNEVSDTNRVRGTAGEESPYGEIKEEKIVSAAIGSEGGVLRAELSNNIKVYLVVPPNYSGFGGDVYKLTPYFSMPTSENAPALPTDFGFGVDFEIENSHFDNIEPLYLIFDLDGGKTISEIRKDPKLNQFCLPTVTEFDPAGCAFLKNISTKDHTNTKYAVVSPIRNPEYDNLMFMNTTVPIGYDNLLVVQITKQATFIPVKLSKDVLTDLIRANKPGFTMPQIEAITLAIQNNIFHKDPTIYDHINKVFYSGGDPFESFKALDVLPKYKDYLTEARKRAGEIATKDLPVANVEGSIDSNLNSQDTLLEETKGYLIKNLEATSKTSSSDGYTALSSIFQVRRMERENFAGAKELRIKMTKNIFADIDYFIDADYDPSVNNFLMLLAYVWGRPEVFPSVKIDGKSGFNFLTRIALADEPPPPPNSEEEARKFVEKALKQIEKALQNKCSSSFDDLIKAAMLADAIGRSTLKNAVLEVIIQKILDSLRFNSGQSAIGVFREWEEAQRLGVDERYKCVNDLYRDKSVNSSTRLSCETLIKKNLKNFAYNELNCKELTVPGGTLPKIPKDCGISPEELPPLCPSE
ncbi:hypothetical protein A2716_03080 [candidate division WWE3 bacterium RIFCSPHIGHO2_01_FULL_40_23]|uniref:Uncharacterized protein n=1 Tax=candidate division WWE3 bacterium RIFCSPLOWO2_01_FULL_41_18 TaxID=1802625 RepID=A0A1F4VC26_UNCKA|nr:MAG: hypothetical protein A2716_03080 [candidate division WWE3 bacterium RIFCSPHIGHO2_01_FULL_40_23]OGC54811.1 MAG: hypothetical protein A3A78_05035 [candidate division WWE3 bacterium RIFCSPLOWO2_01_FULL_41_18]